MDARAAFAAQTELAAAQAGDGVEGSAALQAGPAQRLFEECAQGCGSRGAEPFEELALPHRRGVHCPEHGFGIRGVDAVLRQGRIQFLGALGVIQEMLFPVRGLILALRLAGLFEAFLVLLEEGLYLLFREGRFGALRGRRGEQSREAERGEEQRAGNAWFQLRRLRAASTMVRILPTASSTVRVFKPQSGSSQIFSLGRTVRACSSR